MALLDLLGRRWAMGIIWCLAESEPSTFRALQEACESISPTMLNQRLKELKAALLVDTTDQGYVLTALGQRVYGDLVPLGATAKAWADELRSQPQPGR